VSRLASPLAAIVLVLSALTAGTSVVLATGNGGAAELPGAAMVALGGFTFAAVGALLMHRRRENAVGWLLGGYGLLFCFNLTVYEDVARVQAGGGPSPMLGVGSIAHAAGWMLGLTLLGLAVLLFPTGRPPSRRWHLVVWLHAAGGAGVLASTVLLWPHRGLALTLDGDLPGAAGTLFRMAQGPLFTALALALASLGVRYRRAGTEERLQLKWLLLAATFLIAGPLIFWLTGSAPGEPGGTAGELVVIAGLYGVPIAIGIAILKHRLYEIDRLISRTVAYVVISALLVALYAVGVFALSPLVAGMGSGSELAVAASTLAVAAAFGPVRRRVQAVFDRRFNRARYDAQRTVSGFAGRLRDEVHLEDLRAELVGVVDEVMEPASASLWLRERAVR
jgi:hypothetical protein